MQNPPESTMDAVSFFKKVKKDKQLTIEQRIDKCKGWFDTDGEKTDSDIRWMNFMIKMMEKISRDLLKRLKEEGGFPYLVDRTASGPHYPKAHDHVEVNERKVMVREAISSIEKLMDNEFWEVPFGEEEDSCHSERGVAYLVVRLLKQVLKGLKLQHCVTVIQDRSLAGVECDILLVYKPNLLPFATLEVKKPGNPEVVFEGMDEEENSGRQNRVAGQVFNQLRALQLYGFPSVVGMLTTWNQWRIMGLPEPDNNYFQEIEKTFEKHPRTNVGERDHSNVSVQADSSAELKPKFDNETQATEQEHKLWAGEIVPPHNGKDTDQFGQEVKNSGKAIVSQVVLFVIKAWSILSDFLETKPPNVATIKSGQKLPCRVLDPQNPNQFAFSTRTLTSLKLQTFVKKNVEIYVIRHLGMGNSGNVCLGTTKDGGCCAIKFYHDSEERQFAEQECKNWKEIYGDGDGDFQAFLHKTPEGPCLVMPYCQPIPEEDRQGLLDDGSIKEALEKFADSGYIHRGTKWCHFCRWKDEILLIDLGPNGLERVEKKDRNQWIEKAIETLQQNQKKRKRVSS